MLSMTHDMMDYRDPWNREEGTQPGLRGIRKDFWATSPHPRLDSNFLWAQGFLTLMVFSPLARFLRFLGRCELEGRGCLCPQHPSGMPTVGE